ncbi:MAG: hypothetical protein L3V56_11840 [Candidatus Magnetoovum sp. WYHC-5]|nr:hypothetical protein [Candidatus Magnetoovum sp. WYHC-5]
MIQSKKRQGKVGCILLLTLLFQLFISSLVFGQEGNKNQVTISSPADGSNVACKVGVKGTVTRAPGNSDEVVVFVHRADFVTEWWPQSKIIDSNGNWSVMAYAGIIDDINFDFEIAAMTVSTSDRNDLDDYRQKDRGDSITLPEPTSNFVKIKVKKTSHDCK